MKNLLLTFIFTLPFFSFSQWNLATNYPSSGIMTPFCFTVYGKAYIGCGYNASFSSTVSNYEYDPVLNTWITKSVPPFAARMGAFSFSIGSFGYVGSGSPNGGATVLNDFWRYDPASDTWTAMSAFPGVGRIEAATFVINGKGYVVSGVRSSGNPIDCWEYDPSSNSWTAMNNPPVGFTSGYVTGFANGNFGYVGIGGGNSSSNNDFWRFDPVTNSWTQLASLPSIPSTRTWCVSGMNLIGGKGFVGLGGFSSTSNVDFWAYDFTSNSWQSTPSTYNFPYGLSHGRSFSLNGDIYVGTGGKVGGVENNIYKFACELLPTNINTGLLAYYPFNSGSINDFSGNNNNLFNINGAISTNDRNANPNCAFEFDNLPSTNNQYLTTSNTTFLNGLTEFSVSCWYKAVDPSRDAGIYEGLVNRDLGFSCPDRLGQWSLGLYDCRRSVFARTNSVWENPSPCDVAANTGTWHHLTASYNQTGNTIKLYKDGVLQNTATGTANCGSPVTSNDVGDLFVGKGFTGIIDDIFIHNRELTLTEVNQLYNLGSTCCQNPNLSTGLIYNNSLDKTYLYPNPTSNSFHLMLENQLGGVVKIYSSNGILIKTIEKYNGNAIDMKELNSGLYLVLYEINGIFNTTKLIKSK
jgi:hypothetical protein